ncbi:baculoviral IAP repeat-containing protein 1e isoform X1 [Amia ocellicauda]|uniref:baculoviral IAP repeat-containing protein 1e isoform X1 n=1 Tax=Amia ocellicauda TaxID=2972642 RepID=UPI00346478D2
MAVEQSSATQDPKDEFYYNRKEISIYDYPLPLFNLRAVKTIEDMENSFQMLRRQTPRRYNPRMRSELERLRSFQWEDVWGSPSELAEAGFYSIAEHKAMQCFCCGILVCYVPPQRSPLDVHEEREPGCGFITGKDVRNIPKYDTRVQASDYMSPDTFDTKEKRLESFSNWPFYTQIDTVLFADAGFVYTGQKDNVLCFSCGGCLGHWEVDDDPWREHAKWFPECEYLQNEKTREEIQDYINTYDMFKGVKGSNYNNVINTPVGREFIFPTLLGEKQNIFEDERLRLESFLHWPADSPTDPKDLSRAGFFYTGTQDMVKCFICGIEDLQLKEGDVPSEYHRKYSPKCSYVLQMLQHPENTLKSESASKKEIPITKQAVFPETKYMNEDLKEYEERLSTFLKTVYNSPEFRKTPVAGDISHFAVDLKLTFMDLAMTLADAEGNLIKMVTLPDILKSLSGLTFVEGERGMGKTALLKKIAILWASEHCPVLSRFQFVFYASLSEINADPSLRAQLAGMMRMHAETSLFLLDDFEQEDHHLLETLAERAKPQEGSRCFSAVVALRPLLMASLGFPGHKITLHNLPTSRVAYLVKRVMAPHLKLMKKSLFKICSPSFKKSLKIPFCALALCVSLVQKPGQALTPGSSFYSTYLRHLRQGQAKDEELLLTEMLAWEGLMSNRSEFSEQDLAQAGLNPSHLTDQGLLVKGKGGPPLLRFVDETFQEYLAGRYLATRFNADNPETAMACLSQIMPFPKAIGLHYLLLVHCCHLSARAAAVIIPQLLAQYSHIETWTSTDADKGIDAQFSSLTVGSSVLSKFVKIWDQLVKGNPELRTWVVDRQTFHLTSVEWVLKLIYESHSTAVGLTLVREHLAGKTLQFDPPLPQGVSVLRFMADCPECLSELRCVRVSLSDCLECVETDPSQPYSWTFVQIPKEFIAAFQPAQRQNITGQTLQLVAQNVSTLERNDIFYLSVLFSLFRRIEVEVHNSPGFLSAIESALEKYKENWERCQIVGSDLTLKDRHFLCSNSALKVLELEGMPEYVLCSLGKFTSLEELCVSVSPASQIVENIVLGFRKLVNMKSIKLYNIDLSEDSSSLAWFIKHFSSLAVFHLKCISCPGFEDLVKALSCCKELQELSLEIFKLNTEQIITLTQSLKSLSHLECLKLSGGSEMTQRGDLIVQLLPSFPSLHTLQMDSCLNNDSLHILAQAAKAGHLLRLRKLLLNDNYTVTDLGWRRFFEGLDNLGQLSSLSLSRRNSVSPVDPGEETIQVLVRAVSRMPCLRFLSLVGWFSKEEDTKLVRALEESHSSLVGIDLHVVDFQPPDQIKILILKGIRSVFDSTFT